MPSKSAWTGWLPDRELLDHHAPAIIDLGDAALLVAVGEEPAVGASGRGPRSPRGSWREHPARAPPSRPQRRNRAGRGPWPGGPRAGPRSALSARAVGCTRSGPAGRRQQQGEPGGRQPPPPHHTATCFAAASSSTSARAPASPISRSRRMDGFSGAGPDRRQHVIPRGGLPDLHEVVQLGRLSFVGHDLVQLPAPDDLVERQLHQFLGVWRARWW